MTTIEDLKEILREKGHMMENGFLSVKSCLKYHSNLLNPEDAYLIKKLTTLDEDQKMMLDGSKVTLEEHDGDWKKAYQSQLEMADKKEEELRQQYGEDYDF